MLRVLIVEPSGKLWGSERVLIDFLDYVDYSTIEVLVCCPPRSPIVKILRQQPIEVSTIFEANLHQRGKAARLRTTARLLAVAHQYRPDLIYVNQAGATRISLFIARILHIPVVTHVRIAEDVAYVSGLKSKQRDLPQIICISNYIHNLFPQQSHLQSRLTTLYDPYTLQNTIDNHSTSISNVTKPSFISVGRIVELKGQNILLEAIACLYQRDIKATACFVGNTDKNNEFETYLHKLSADLGVENQINWLGFQENVLAHIANKDALVVTSHKEALGRVIFEAWDAGTIPVVWAGSGGAAEIIQTSGGGLLYEDQTGESLAAILRQVSSLNDTERKDMVNHGRNWLTAHCDPQQYAFRMQHIWQTVTKAL